VHGNRKYRKRAKGLRRRDKQDGIGKKATRKYVTDCYAKAIAIEITVISDNGIGC